VPLPSNFCIKHAIQEKSTYFFTRVNKHLGLKPEGLTNSRQFPVLWCCDPPPKAWNELPCCTAKRIQRAVTSAYPGDELNRFGAHQTEQAIHLISGQSPRLVPLTLILIKFYQEQSLNDTRSFPRQAHRPRQICTETPKLLTAIYSHMD